jgi:hypothetical protein
VRRCRRTPSCKTPSQRWRAQQGMLHVLVELGREEGEMPASTVQNWRIASTKA